MKALSLRACVLSWLALLTLLAITLFSAYFHLGVFNIVINMAIATVKALIVMFVFMNLYRQAPLLRLFAFAGFFWLAILVALSLTDFLTRPSAATPVSLPGGLGLGGPGVSG